MLLTSDPSTIVVYLIVSRSHEKELSTLVVNLQGTTGSIWNSKVPMDSLGPLKFFRNAKN